MKKQKNIALVVLSLILSANFLFAGDSAMLKCLQVDTDGAVMITWTAPENNTGFVSYEIYYSKNGSAFNLIATIDDANTTQYFHPGAEANLAGRYYTIQTNYNQDSTLSDTLQTIFLQLDNNAPDFNKADLFWNALHNPLPEGSSRWYRIFRESPPGNWQFIDSVPNDSLFYSKPEIVCHDSISYRIEMENGNGCRSVSNIQGATFIDMGLPEKPAFDSVSINFEKHAVLGWAPSASKDVSGYLIYRFENTGFIIQDTVYGRDSTYFTDTVPSPCLESISYAIASLDSCGNRGPGTFFKPRKTILLSDILYNVCEETNTLTWTQYINALPDLDGYKIFSSRNGGPFELVGQTSPGNTVFVHDSLVTGSDYVYFIRAFFEKGSSTSCRKAVTATGYIKPGFVYLANADVLPSYEVELTLNIDTLPDNCTWQIWRSDAGGENAKKIGNMECNKPLQLPLKYKDTTADASLGFYEYTIKVLDSCGRETLESNQAKTIFLSGINTDANHNYLQWNAFEGWDAGVKQYYIFRMTGSTEPTRPLDSVDSQTLEYTDDISSLPDTGGPIVYWVQAIENAGDTTGYQEKARSNRIGATPESDMFVPNAFKLGGNTPEFKPVFRFFSGAQYLFQIFNRWGQLIFESRNPNDGWSGRYKGHEAEQGIYIYRLSYLNADKSSVIKQGTVMVVY